MILADDRKKVHGLHIIIFTTQFLIREGCEFDKKKKTIKL